MGVKRGSTPSFERRKRGRDAEIRVERVEWRKVTGAMAQGMVHEVRDCSVESMERGGCVDGVRMSLVRAMSSGESRMPAIPDADTATAREVRGDGDARISSPPA